ncbi:MAG: DUF447 family protein [Pirellulales bacterium]|nr:DUF447 family protein [Pirellulales bacterium]
MILEGIVTTENADGSVNVAPMGPTIDDRAATSGDITRLKLRPFPDSTTFANLRRTGRGVFHVVDDVEFLARAAIGRLEQAPRYLPPADGVCHVLTDCCRWYAFEVQAIDEAGQRVTIEAQVTQAGRRRDFVGFHRARYAVLEGAILATRVHVLPAAEIEGELARLAIVVNKTGGAAEQRAFELLRSYVAEKTAAGKATHVGQSVRVVAPSRLHFGLLSFGETRSRQFGGMGAMIDRPGLELLLEPAAAFSATGPLAARIEQFAARVVRRGKFDIPPCRLRLVREPGEHIGLGTGTQLGLAVAAALHAFAGRPLPAAADLAAMVERGLRSAIGVYGFLGGGLIVEAGKLADEVLAPLVSRIALPAEWRFVLVTPQHPPGMAGDAERHAFETLPAVPISTTERLCREILLGMLPAAASGDLTTFGEALYRYNRRAGECFAAAQGGAFAGEQVERLVETIRQQGVSGVGQSSWGPTIFALAAHDDEAQAIVAGLRTKQEWREAEYVIAAPNVGGAKVEFV